MKKFAIMFVMLLGSVATMQAQTFDFSCVEQLSAQQIEINNYNDQNSDQVTDWNGSTANYSIGNVDYTITSPNSNWEAQDDEALYNTIVSGSLANVIFGIINFHANLETSDDDDDDDDDDNSAGTDPDTDGDGFTDAEEAFIATYSEPFVDGGDGSYRLNGTGDYHLLITIADDGSFIMTEVGGNDDVWPNPAIAGTPDTLTLGVAVTYAIGYFDAQN